jgi:hypothetical protein
MKANAFELVTVNLIFVIYPLLQPICLTWQSITCGVEFVLESTSREGGKMILLLPSPITFLSNEAGVFLSTRTATLFDRTILGASPTFIKVVMAAAKSLITVSDLFDI